MLPTHADAVRVDGAVVLEQRVEAGAAESESWIDTQVEESDKRNEF
jgi:hypothetical protein